MKIKIGDITKRQISKICQQTKSCRIEASEYGYVCPLFNELDCLCMVGSPDVDDYDNAEVDIPEDALELDSTKEKRNYV